MEAHVSAPARASSKTQSFASRLLQSNGMKQRTTSGGSAPLSRYWASAGRATLAYASSSIVIVSAAAAGHDDAPVNDQLDVIYVSARKQAENLRDVPISISMLGGEQIREQQIMGLEDVSRYVPDLSIRSYGTSGLSQFAIRGVSSAAGSSIPGQETVGIYLDEVSMSTPTGVSVGTTALKFFDLDHVEVLRGPQGTLYGASSMGGTIRLVSNQPEMSSYSSYINTTMSATERGGFNYLAEGVVNIPLLTDSLSLRVGAQRSQNSGWITVNDRFAGTTTPRANEETSDAIRASLRLLSAGHSLEVIPSVFLQRVHSHGTNEFEPDTHYLADYYSRNDLLDETRVASLTVHEDFGWAELTSSTSYFWRRFRGDLDFTATFTRPAIGLAWPTPFLLPTQVTQPSEELRLASKPMQESGLPIAWIAGIYSADNRTTLGNYLDLGGDFSAFTSQYNATYGPSALDSLGLRPFGNELYTQLTHAGFFQNSIFGELYYSPLTQLTATVGLRYLVAKESNDTTSGGWFTGATTSSNTRGRNHALTPKFAIRYSIGDRGAVYVNAAKGFRLGGINLPVVNDPQTVVGAACLADLRAIGLQSAPLNYQPDSLWSYELGARSNFLRNRLSVDLALFHIKWSGVQQDILLEGKGCGYDFIANAGSADSNGVDLELKAKPASGLTVTITGNITHAALTRAAPDTGTAEGDWLTSVPRWTASSGAEYNVNIASLNSTFGIRGNWVGPSHQGFDSLNPAFYMPAYFVLDSDIATHLGAWRIALFGKNLLQQDKTIQQQLTLPRYGTTIRPRTVGVSVYCKF